MKQNDVLKTLNHILELELAGVVRYTHYALMVYGFNRIPIVDWLQKNADEGLLHARLAGELVTDRKSTRLNSSHIQKSRMPSSA